MSGLRVLVLGASLEEHCGVRDYARTLDRPLQAAGVETETVWWDGGPIRDFLARVDGRIREQRPDFVLWHYSVFAWSHRGIPVSGPLAALRLHRHSSTLVVLLHEFAYPWGRRGLRGAVQAATQRAGLVPVWRAANGVVVTTEARRAWLESRRWLPSRPVVVMPVVSNVPDQPVPAVSRNGNATVIGVFGYRAEGTCEEVVVEALRLLRERGVATRLLLIGAPGRESAPGRRWLAAAEKAGVGETLEFTGALEQDALAVALGGVDLVVFPHESGPSTRRGALAASFAHGKAVVALDGPERSDAFVEDGALAVSVPEPAALATELEQVISDPELRHTLERRSRDFYVRNMSADVVAGRLLAFLRSLEAR